ncbi:MAG: rhodanese-like domain-containing protein [Rhodocyclaceae bacterium]
MTERIAAATARAWLHDGDEIALLDVREAGQFGEGHAFFAVNAPYSRLELDIGARVPRLGTRIVLIDDDDGVADRAAARLDQLGYTRITCLAGGATAWREGGGALFKGVNVPSKTFGEWVEQVCHTPHISAADLHARQQAGDALTLLDGRTLAEHHKMAVPGAQPVPNGELALRAASLIADPVTPVVVHCAGRTRSIIGAQTLRHLGLPNPVLALENGTQGWRLAGLDLEYGSPRTLPPPAADQGAWRARARRFAERAGAPVLTAIAAQAWLDDAQRTTYLIDMRTAEEYASGTLTHAVNAPGGQLIQATDQYMAVRGARVLLVDDDDIRAPVVAAWLRQMGWQAATVEGGISAALHAPQPRRCTPAAVATLDSDALAAAQARGVPLLDLRSSHAYRDGHVEGARWSIRPRLPAAVHGAGEVVLIGEQALVALAADDLRQAGVDVQVATQQVAATLPQARTPHLPANDEAIDYLFFVHDRHDGNLDAARRYLAWETGLIAQCQADELAAFAALP